MKLVSEAQRSRAPMQRLADKAAGYFVPAVIASAAITFLAWVFLGPQPRFAHALVAAVAVLIIACPCALGLATPMSILVAVGRGAQAGVLVRNAEALETLAKVDTLVVDKTGTLTEGKPQVVRVAVFPDASLSETACLARGQVSKAPARSVSSRPIVRAAEERRIDLSPVSDFAPRPEGGAEGRARGEHSLDRRADNFFEARGVNASTAVERCVHRTR